jgi:hypothetical protein
MKSAFSLGHSTNRTTWFRAPMLSTITTSPGWRSRMKRRVIPVTHLETKIATRDRSAISRFQEGFAELPYAFKVYAKKLFFRFPAKPVG